jgi:hypothetical protein
MSLVVCVYKMDWDDKIGECKMEDMGFRRPIGGENWRRFFYGSDKAKSLGLKLIPTLAQGDIYAGGEELELLEQEIKIMKENLVSLVGEGSEQKYAQRLEYILQAIEHAKSLQAHVVLW